MERTGTNWQRWLCHPSSHSQKEAKGIKHSLPSTVCPQRTHTTRRLRMVRGATVASFVLSTKITSTASGFFYFRFLCVLFFFLFSQSCHQKNIKYGAHTNTQHTRMYMHFYKQLCAFTTCRLRADYVHTTCSHYLQPPRAQHAAIHVSSGALLQSVSTKWCGGWKEKIFRGIKT